MVLTESLVHDSHQAFGFSGFWFTTQGAAEVSFGLGKLTLIKGSPANNQIVGTEVLARP